MFVNKGILNLLKYLVYGIFLFITVNIIPQKKLASTDTLIMVAIIMSSFVILDFICPSKNIKNDGADSDCDCVCPLPAKAKTIAAEPAITTEPTKEKFDGVGPDFDYDDELDVCYANNETDERGIVRPKPKKLVRRPKKQHLPDGVVVVDENIFSEAIYRPLGEYTDDFTNEWRPGYSYLNTNKWTPGMQTPPVCRMASGGSQTNFVPNNYSKYTDLMEWNYARRPTGPIGINQNYVKHVLNSQGPPIEHRDEGKQIKADFDADAAAEI